MFIAIEMENAESGQKVVKSCKEKSLLTFYFLSSPESFRIAPPLIMNDVLIKETSELIISVLDEL